MNVQKAKINHNSLLQPSGHYPNQQPGSSTPYNHSFDDASPKYAFGAPYVGVTGVPVAGQVPARLPLTAPLPGPNPPIATPPTGPNSVGGMPQGPPPGSFVGHGPLDLSKQTPPIHQPAHQPAHHPLPPGGLAVSQQIPMANAGHGPMQGRPPQGNSQYNNRYAMRNPGNHIARPTMPTTSINPNHPSNTPSMQFPNASHQPVLFVIGDNYNGQPFVPTFMPPYYSPGGTMPPNVAGFNPRATQQQSFYRSTAPYQYQLHSTPAVYFSPQQQQPQPPQPQQPQQQQQPPQPQAAVPPPVVPPGASAPQPRESTATQRRQRSSALRIVDPNTNRDVLTGEEVPPPAATPPIVAATAEETSSPAITPSATPAPAVPTPTPTPAPVSAHTPSVSETTNTDLIEQETATPVVPASADNVEPVTAIVEVQVESEAATIAIAEEAPTSIPPAVEEAATVPDATTVEEVKLVESTPSTGDKELSNPVARENGLSGDLPSESQSSTSPTPVSTPTSPETGEGRSTQKRKGRKGSRPGATPTPPASEDTSPQPTSQLSRDSSDKGNSSAAVAESAPVVEAEESPKQEEPAQLVADKSKEATEAAEAVEPAAETVLTNGDQVAPTSSTMTPESETTPPSAVADDGEAQPVSKTCPAILRYSYKDDQWSPLNPEGKKTYDRTFLLELQNNPASQRKPEGLPNLEVVRDKSSVVKRLDAFMPPFLKPVPGKGIPKRNSQQGSQRSVLGEPGLGMGQQPPRREIRLQTSIARMERVEDSTNLWKPKHAVRSKDDDPEKLKTDEMLKTVRGILNKLTPSKFDKLLNRIQSLNIDTEDRLSGVIKLFFEKAVDEPIFSSMYAKMCHALTGREVASSANPAETTNFRKLLLNRCQREFEKDSAGLKDVETKKKEIETAEGDEKKKLEEDLEELINKNRRRSLGNIRFIGELFKLRILSGKIMHQCIVRLLREDDEDSLECLCRLLSTIGKELETPSGGAASARSASISQNRETMNQYFSQLDSIVRQRKTTSRIRFMIQDVIDLRRNNWKPRRDDNNPKTIEQIHKDAERERDEQEKELMNAPVYPGSGGPMGQNSRDRPGDRRDRDDRDRKRSRGGGGGGASEDGWTISGRSSKVDMKLFKIPKLTQSGDSDQQGAVMLGPGGRGMGQSWGRGASGGMSATAAPPESSGGRSNRYQLLDDDSSSVPESKAPFSGRSSLGGPPSRGHQEYRPVSGATKSAFFPTKDSDRERSMDAVRPHNVGPLGRSRSQQSSRESSVTRPVREPTHPQNLPSRESPKEQLRGKASATKEEIELKAQSLVAEYLVHQKMEDVVLELKESLHSSNVSKFIDSCIMCGVEHDRGQRKALGSIIKEMTKRRYFVTDDIVAGFSELLQCADDFLVDIPKLWEYLAELVEPLFTEGVVPLSLLGQLSSSVNTSLVANFVAAIIKELVITQSVEAVGSMWSASNIQLSTLLHNQDPVEFAQKHKLEFLLKVESPTASVADKPSSTASSGSASTPSDYADFQRRLENYLRSGTHSSDEVCLWIRQNSPFDIDAAFIRALVTAVTESCIEGEGTDSKLNLGALKNLGGVLASYVENVPDLELHALYAVQSLVTHRQHPKGLIQGVFDALYDCNVVSEEGFETWVSAEDPSERDGKAIALKSLTSFLTWLKEADPESDQDAEG